MLLSPNTCGSGLSWPGKFSHPWKFWGAQICSLLLLGTIKRRSIFLMWRKGLLQIPWTCMLMARVFFFRLTMQSFSSKPFSKLHPVKYIRYVMLVFTQSDRVISTMRSVTSAARHLTASLPLGLCAVWPLMTNLYLATRKVTHSVRKLARHVNYM